MWSLPILPITPERHGEPRLLYQSHGEIDTLRAIAIVGDELHVKGSDGGGDVIMRLDKRTGGERARVRHAWKASRDPVPAKSTGRGAIEDELPLSSNFQVDHNADGTCSIRLNRRLRR